LEIMPESTTGGHELADHTSEIVLRLHATTFRELIVEAARGFADLVPDRLLGAPEPAPRDVSVPSTDRAAALVGWLNELVYLAEVESWVPATVERVDEGPEGLRIRASGRRLADPFVLVKAATLHGAVLREGPEGFRAEVTLDV
jgi:SHS2 domain-containing protein